MRQHIVLRNMSPDQLWDVLALSVVLEENQETSFKILLQGNYCHA